VPVAAPAAATGTGTSPLLSVDDLRVSFGRRGLFSKPVEVLHGVSFDVQPGETFGLVGESGSGKTTIGRAVLGLVKPSGGTISLNGRRIDDLTARRRRRLADDIQVVFQDPYTSLNPAKTIEDILSEPLQVRGASKQDANRRITELLDQVNMPKGSSRRYPREFSGGQRQRVAIARALALEPRLIVCDEPVSALDLSTQSRVLDLLIELQDRLGMSYLFVSHDLSVIRHISHRVAVIHRGDFVETGSAEQVTGAPEHPYTRRLLLAAPVPDPVRQKARRAERLRVKSADAARAQGHPGA
jgi:ABC-type glutathione transport system ATPase component